MRLNEILRLVLINLKQNKFKVFLTSLGIIVGAATIVMVIAIGEGGKQDVEEQFKTLNAGTITVTSGGVDMESMMGAMGGGMPSGGTAPSGGAAPSGGSAPSGGGGGTRSSSGGTNSRSASMLPMSEGATLTQENLEEIMYFVPDIVAGAIFATVESEVLSDDLEEALTFDIIATQSSYAQISNLSLMIGSFITDEEVENETRSVILGYNTAFELFGSPQYAYDARIEIDGREYVVNGVLAQMGTVTSGVNPDDSIFMPYSTADKYLLERDTQPQISVLAMNVNAVESIIENIQLVLTQANPNATYTVEDAGATMDAAMQSANTLSVLLLAVAVIVFIVGGIGIMNVLFVSVKERTREIGILKSLGTKKRDILFLFLLEAGMIGIIGGLLGVGLSFAVMPLMQYTDMTVVITTSSILLAFLFALFTGTAFGFYPAWKASNLIPIEALNNE